MIFHSRVQIFLIEILLANLVLTGCGSVQVTPTQATQITSPTPTVIQITPVEQEMPELASNFMGYSGAFVLYDSQANRFIRYNPQHCEERYLPASTFKILNSLIGLETGVIPDENYVIHWDGTKYPIETWNQDHSMKTAIQNSVVWYYQELARRVGADKMKYWVEKANYGNYDISGNLDSFWLDGSLRISANEQIDFLQRLYTGQLPFSAHNIAIVKNLIIQKTTANYQLSGKTGSTQRVATHIGWFVGYVEKGGNVYYFATNIESDNQDGLANGETAKKISTDILRRLEILDDSQ
jgi:beta-lactamase class D